MFLWWLLILLIYRVGAVEFIEEEFGYLNVGSIQLSQDSGPPSVAPTPWITSSPTIQPTAPTFVLPNSRPSANPSHKPTQYPTYVPTSAPYSGPNNCTCSQSNTMANQSTKFYTHL